MRNLKRALSLALASVMLMGMMVVGTSAKGLEDFSDAAEITNADAVAVTSAIGIFEGYDDGEFKGDVNVTRAQMAVIIAKMLYGADVKVEQFAEIDTFSDVPAWAEGYVNLVASLGIVAGVGDGKFDPNSTVTTAQAAMMLTKALGYFQNPGVELAKGWEMAATAKATQLGLYGDLKLSAAAGLSREDVAVMVFNALTKAVPVQYNELLGVYYNENQGIIYSLEYNYLETLGYKNFDLVYVDNDVTDYGRPATTWGVGTYKGQKEVTSSGNKYEVNADGGLIASNVRIVSTDEIITIPNTPDYVYTTTKTEKNVYKDLGASVCNDIDDVYYAWEAYIDGELQNGVKVPEKDETANWGYTNKGAVVEVYIDDNENTVTVVEINYYIGEVSDVEDGVITIDAISDLENDAVLADDEFEADFEEDDYVVFTVDCEYRDEAKTEPFVASVVAPVTETGIVDRVENRQSSEKAQIRLENGEKYAYSINNVYNLDDLTAKDVHPTNDKEYTLFLDPNGYVLGYNQADEGEAEYLYVIDSWKEYGDWTAKVLLADGTITRVDLNGAIKGLDVDNDDEDDSIVWVDADDGDSDGISTIDKAVWAYSVNDKGVYKLAVVEEEYIDTQAATKAEQTVYFHEHNNEKADIYNDESFIEFTSKNDTKDFIVDEDTIFVDKADETAFIGYTEVPNYNAAEFVAIVDGGIAEVVFVISGDKYNKNATYFMIDGSEKTWGDVYDGEDYLVYFDAYVDGELVEELWIEESEVDSFGGLKEGYLYQIKKTVGDEGQYITEIELVTGVDKDMPVQDLTVKGNKAFYLGATEAAADKYTVNDETIFVIVTAEYKANGAYAGEVTIEKGDLSDAKLSSKQIKDGWDVLGQVVKADERKAELVYIYRYDVNPTLVGPAVSVDGIEEYAEIIDFDAETLEGVVGVIDRYNTEKSAITLATEALNDAGYVVDYVIGGTTIVATAVRSDRQVTFEMLPMTAYKATIDSQYAEIDGDVYYVVEGYEFEIELTAAKTWEGYTIEATGFDVEVEYSEDYKTLTATLTAQEVTENFVSTVKWVKAVAEA